MKRIAFAMVLATVTVASLGGAPQAQFDYYLTGSGTDAVGPTRSGHRL